MPRSAARQTTRERRGSTLGACLVSIARSAQDNENGYLAALYLGALLTGALLVFGSVVAARLRRSEPDGGWWLIALVGIAASAIGLVTDTLVLTFVRAVGHGVRGEMLWIGYP